MDKLGVNPDLLISQILNFIVVLILLRVLLYKPILNALEARKQKIQESLDYAERIKRESAEQQKEFERKLDETRREAQAAAAVAAQSREKEREAVLAQARDEARKLIDQAKEQIEYERKQAMSEMRAEVVNLAMLAAQKVVSQSLDERAHRQLIGEFIAQAERLEVRN